MRPRPPVRLLAGLFIVALTPAASGQGSDFTFTVTNTLDDGSAGSLRWAINQANALNVSGRSILIDFALPGGSTAVALTGPILPPLNAGRGGAPGANTNSLTIGPAAPGVLAVDGGGAARGTGIPTAYSGAVTVRNLTLVNGLARGGAGAGAGGAARVPATFLSRPGAVPH
jgi:hypothetical protein